MTMPNIVATMIKESYQTNKWNQEPSQFFYIHVMSFLWGEFVWSYNFVNDFGDFEIIIHI